MRKKICSSLILISVIVLLLSSIISTTFLYNYFNKEQVEKLSVELEFISDAVDEMGVGYLSGIDTDLYRFTVIAKDGRVVYDTMADISLMENHADREEVKEALEQGKGSSARYSDTLTEQTFYEATLLKDGNVLRISANQLSIGGAFLKILPMNILIAVVVVIICFILSRNMAKHITAPLKTLDLENPSDNDTYEELSPMLLKLHKQHKQIKEQMEELRYKNEEFIQIISSMNEGLIILDEHGIIIAMNSSAQRIFSAKDSAIGEDFHLIDRTLEIRNALDTVKQDNHIEVVIDKNGRVFQFNISLIVNDGKTVGTLMLAFDITEKAFLERNRQEFTANVSHELKTPLQSIIGWSELMENGLVKAEDYNRFSGNIKKESTRLVGLIEDIIRLSQLDERAELEKEDVNLAVIAEEVVEVLGRAAKEKNVELKIEAVDVVTNGVRRYLYEIIYNLCDNAIRYNKEGGLVTIKLKKDENKSLIIVTDTGIGIPEEHQSRIFERFYRVDKSHSKETGGTGLGLSIVKRAVMLHNGQIELNSTKGEGTKVTITLPCKTNI